MTVERGLSAGTVRGYVDIVRPFVESRVTSTGEVELWELSPADVLGFLLAETGRRSRKSSKLLVSALRSLLGFWHVQGLIGRPLAGAVPSVAGWRLAGLPRALDARQVRALLDSCDRSTVAGKRDFAILTLLVRLGMRRGEVAALTLDDIDWRAGEIVVHGKGARVERLPLPADVGEAIAVYLRDARPAGFSGREVFVRIKAPRQPLTAGGITQVVVSASKRAGLGEVTAHRLRHTAATELLRQGAPLQEIGELLQASQRPDDCDLCQGRSRSPARARAPVADGWRVMTTLEQQAADYLQIRRALGFKLERAEKLLAQYLAYLDTTGQDHVTVENALGWARLPAAGTSGSWWAFRLSVVRCFATYLQRARSRARDPASRRARTPDPTRGPVSL